MSSFYLTPPLYYRRRKSIERATALLVKRRVPIEQIAYRWDRHYLIQKTALIYNIEIPKNFNYSFQKTKAVFEREMQKIKDICNPAKQVPIWMEGAQ